MSLYPPTPSTDPASPDGLAAAVRSAAAKDGNADFSKVSKAVEEVEASRKARIEKALSAVADLEVMGGAKGKRFVLTYWQQNEVHTVYGTEYPVKRDEDGDPVGLSVSLLNSGYTLMPSYETISSLRKDLDNRKFIYSIAHFDK